jgi:hypothetical protein
MTGWNGMTPTWRAFTNSTDLLILQHWRAGLDTLDIARAMGIAESEIANRLPHILEEDRQEQGWNSTLQNTG